MLRNYEKSYDRLSHGNELFPSPLLMLLNALLQSVVKKIEHRNGLQTSTSIKKIRYAGTTPTHSLLLLERLLRRLLRLIISSLNLFLIGT